ncbi:17683_t:CDS:1, partial [Cetraspora pellucida]
MEKDNLFDESFTNQSNNLSNKNENEISERLGHNNESKKQSWVYKYFKSKKVVEVTKKKSNIEVIYSSCNILNDSGIKCNVQLKIVGGLTLKLISYLWNCHGIMQNEHELDN